MRREEKNGRGRERVRMLRYGEKQMIKKENKNDEQEEGKGRWTGNKRQIEFRHNLIAHKILLQIRKRSITGGSLANVNNIGIHWERG